ncbi:unnamed protein product [Symbiodinium natans]|uniref:Uncharacterized protein n=1 Tax=Symbiodinium natans TaxID=878477 RepID=A0A812QMZ9_9DINO|nr:unnamed protein product [Symbiodinium natans]
MSQEDREFWTGSVLDAPALAPGCALSAKLPFAALLETSSFDTRPRRMNQVVLAFQLPEEVAKGTALRVHMPVGYAVNADCLGDIVPANLLSATNYSPLATLSLMEP